MADISRSHIWCKNCAAIKPMRIDELRGRDVTGAFDKPADIVCEDCAYLITTIYDAAPTPKEPKP